MNKGLTAEVGAAKVIAHTGGVGLDMTKMVKRVISVGTWLFATTFGVVDGEGKVETAFLASSSDLPASILLCRLVDLWQVAAF